MPGGLLPPQSLLDTEAHVEIEFRGEAGETGLVTQGGVSHLQSGFQATNLFSPSFPSQWFAR